MAATPLVSPETSVGTSRSVVVPSPSWPARLPPQHFTPPPLVSAHVCPVAAASATTPDGRAGTATGVRRAVVVPSPSCPLPLPPQHLTPPTLESAQMWEKPTAIRSPALGAAALATGAAATDASVATMHVDTSTAIAIATRRPDPVRTFPAPAELVVMVDPWTGTLRRG